MIQQVADRLVQRGLIISEGDPEAAELLYSKPAENQDEPEGETATAKTPPPPRAAMLTGSYTVGEHNIYMSAKIVRLEDSAVVSAHDWILPLTDNTRLMLKHPPKDEGLTPTVKTSFD